MLTDLTQATPVYDSYETIDEAMQAYHITTNEIVNQYLERLLDPDNAQLGYVSYPPDDGECDATGTNVSTYCLAVVLNKNLEQYEIYLSKNKDKLNVSRNSDGSDAGTITIDDALQQATEQRRTVEDQMSVSEDALDLTLAIYNQVQIVYPVHSELVTMIGNLEDYRKNLASLRDIIDKYPSKFNNASTASCK